MKIPLVKFIFVALIGSAVFLEAIADIYLKKWSQNGKTSLILAGLLIYFVGTIFWAVSLKYEYLSKSISIFTVLNLCVIILIGYFMFGETLTLVSKIGIGLGIISVALLVI